MKKLLLALALIFMATPVLAAVTANNIVTAQIPLSAHVQFLQGTDAAGTYKTIVTGGANTSKISGLWVNVNDGTATHLVTCEVVASAVFYGGAAATTALSSGYANAVGAVNMLSATVWPGLPIDGNGNPYIYLNSGDTLQCTFATALTAAKWINVNAMYANF